MARQVRHSRRSKYGTPFSAGRRVKRPVLWIQKTKIKKGALSRQLGIPEEENIPGTLLDKVVEAKPGQTITNPTKEGKRRIKVTRLMERRAILARNLKNISKRR